ncbi:MAG TPA: NAD(P)-binding domain-containing protein [Streptosporangiaceae bacterium]|nr:NAD(P)-binding domain-containing protein [Streptosporangiaceae bacterium]
MSDTVEVAIVGAGPYGLSLAAHLRKAGVSVRQFGLPMQLWRDFMPEGMFLKSQGFASNLSDPAHTHTLEAFCKATGRPYASYGLPVPLDTFVAYGLWFRDALVPDIEEVLVTDITRAGGEFELTLANSEQARARKVVIAIGVEAFAHVPEPLSALPASVCTHSSVHTDLGAFKGQDVIVVGAGQSALESAALLHEQGAGVTLVAREDTIRWNGAPLALDRPLPQRLKEPESGLGSGWATWFYSNHPGTFRHLPRSTRVYRARTALGPAGASWLRGRVEGQFPALTGQSVTWARMQDGGARLGLTGRDGSTRELAADHVIAATGYRTDLTRLPFLGDQLLPSLRRVPGTGSSVVGRDYQSSVPGLYFMGPAVAPTMGPVMRFVFGSEHAATTVARQLTGGSTVGRARTAVAAGR